MSDESLQARVAALEAKLGIKASTDARKSLIAEITSLEKKLGSYAGDDMLDIHEEPDGDECIAADKDEEEVDATCASEKDPSGIEEEITQDKFSEVEKEMHGEELASAESMEAVGRQVGHSATASETAARLMKASERLDKVANYLEKHGRQQLAFRLDKIADAIDARIKGAK